METEIEWRKVEATGEWEVWGEIPIAHISDINCTYLGEDIAQITRKGYTIDIGYYSDRKFGCRVIKNYDWQHPLEHVPFDHGQDAYDWALEMMKKYG